MSLFAELRQTEYLAHILEGDIGILILDPHCLGCIDRRTAAHCDDPVGLEFKHLLCAVHNGLDGRVGFDTFDKSDFHSGFFQISLGFVKKSESLHRAAAHADYRALAFKSFQSLESSFSVIQVTGESKSCHCFCPP